ncbi:MAG: class I SAM-dependent methyltransferase [Fibromonadaceae bacterium]|jgi:hypothetical protein|nr:class I SAM-dependent methyltransferase [Fibromonadaceae bacterium]
MLYNIFLSNEKKAIDKWAHYFPIYERHFSKFVNKSVNFWEIGVGRGGSLQMRKKYFGPFAKIIGIDICSGCKTHEEEQIKICIGDQSDTVFLQNIIDKYGPPDVVLDDGSHIMKHVCASFDFLYDKVSKNGVYMVEDLHTAYWDSFGGGLKREGTFIECCKDLIDSLNARHIPRTWGGGGTMDNSMQFTNSTYSMNFYDSVVVFEKMEWSQDSLKSIVKPENKGFKIQRATHFFDENDIGFANKKILLFGSGEIGKIAKEKLELNDIKVDYYVDSNICKQGQVVNGIKILSLEKSLLINESVYIISVNDSSAVYCIYKELRKMNVAEENIYKFLLQ